MTELRRVLAGGCERLKAAKAHDPCGCHFPELPRLWVEHQGFASRDLSEFDIVYLFVDGIAD